MGRPRGGRPGAAGAAGPSAGRAWPAGPIQLPGRRAPARVARRRGRPARDRGQAGEGHGGRAGQRRAQPPLGQAVGPQRGGAAGVPADRAGEWQVEVGGDLLRRVGLVADDDDGEGPLGLVVQPFEDQPGALDARDRRAAHERHDVGPADAPGRALAGLPPAAVDDDVGGAAGQRRHPPVAGRVDHRLGDRPRRRGEHRAHADRQLAGVAVERLGGGPAAQDTGRASTRPATADSLVRTWTDPPDGSSSASSEPPALVATAARAAAAVVTPGDPLADTRTTAVTATRPRRRRPRRARRRPRTRPRRPRPAGRRGTPRARWFCSSTSPMASTPARHLAGGRPRVRVGGLQDDHHVAAGLERALGGGARGQPGAHDGLGQLVVEPLVLGEEHVRGDQRALGHVARRHAADERVGVAGLDRLDPRPGGHALDPDVALLDRLVLADVLGDDQHLHAGARGQVEGDEQPAADQGQGGAGGEPAPAAPGDEALGVAGTGAPDRRRRGAGGGDVATTVSAIVSLR